MASLGEGLRSAVRRARGTNNFWVRGLDGLRELPSSAGRARLWTRIVHRNELHQITEYTKVNRYPELFDLAATLRPDAARILSFGCSTGEEIESLRARFPAPFIVGVEINPRSRAAAFARLAKDSNVRTAKSYRQELPFDIVFALAVLQFRPHAIREAAVTDLSKIYPFHRFETEIQRLVDLLLPGGLLCVMNTQYRVEDTRASQVLDPIVRSPALPGPIFGPDERLYVPKPVTSSIFVKRDG